jgi:translation initiation factor 1
MSKKFVSQGGIVFSTNSNFSFEKSDDENSNTNPADQHLKVWLEKNGRGGKTVSIIRGFETSETEIKLVEKALKGICGTGGSAKNNEIIIQGDHREKIVQWLSKEGYNVKKAGG